MQVSRAFLRQTTGKAHRRLDAAMGSLILSKREDYTKFLQVHAIALHCIEQQVGATPPLDLTRMNSLLRQDLDILNANIPETALSIPARAGSQAGVHYVLSGSHFGAAVLLNDWRQSTCKEVATAGSYISAPDYALAWPTVLAQLSALSQAGLDEARRGALWTFGVFEEVARHVLKPEPAPVVSHATS